MATKYRLLKAGQMVTTFRSTTLAPNGREVHLTQNKVGRKGDEFEDLPDFQVEKIQASIDAGKEVWEAVGNEPTAQESEPEQDDVHEHGENIHEHETNYEDLGNDRLDELLVMHSVTLEKGTGAQDKVIKADRVKALLAAHGDE